MPNPADAFDDTNTVPKGAGATATSERAALPGKPNLLEMPEADAAKQLVEEFDRSYPRVKSLSEQWKINRLRAKGYTGLRLIKVQDEQKAYVPPGSSPNIAAMNQAARLKRRMRAHMFADPPIPEATPSTDEDQDRDAAEFATRVLVDLCGEGGISYGILAADAFDIASDYGSGFVGFYVDPHGGGWKPKQMLAAKEAQSTADALKDPTTGQPWPSEYILRYVRNDGTLGDDADDPQIAMQWLPRLKTEVLTGEHVRFIPDTARDIWEADGLQVGAMVPLGALKGLFPEKFASLPAEKVAEIVSARPANAKDLLPRGYKDRQNETDDSTLCFVLRRYYRQTAEYPRGAYLVVAGADIVLHRGEWWDATNREPLDIPVTQFGQFNEKDNPYKIGLMEFLGPGNELRAFLFGAILEHLDRFIRRKTFLPITSNLQPEQLQAETATVLPIVPGGEPIYETLPDIPAVVEKMFAAVKEDLNDESALQQSAQGLNPPGVDSGVHAQAIIEQVTIGLSDLRQNTERGFTRGCRIMLQLMRAHYTVPQQISWKGEDGAYEQREFTGADLGSTRDVGLAKGSFTQLAPSSKAALAQSYAQMGIFSEDELRHAIAGNVGGTIGLDDDPHRLRVRRQISRWGKGPPEGWQPPAPQVDPATQQPVLGPDGQPVIPPDPTLAAIFAPLEVDDDPVVAKLRAYELGRTMASTRFSRWTPEWQAPLRQEYLRARHAAGIFTIAEQQQAQQQQADAAARDAQQKVAAEHERTAADRERGAQDHAVKVAGLVTQAMKAGAQAGAPAAPATAPGGTP